MKRQPTIWQKVFLCLAMPIVTTAALFVPETILAVDENLKPNAVEREMNPQQILFHASDFLGSLPGYRVTIRSSYDTIQADGQRIEFGEKRQILLKRPDRLRVESLASDGDLNLLLFDGQTITAYKEAEKVYARVAQPGSVDAAVVYLVRDLQVRLPLARLLLTSVTKELQRQVESVRFVEEDLLYEEPVDHLAVRFAEVDAQIWIMQGDHPLPRRIVITYKNDPGQPQFRADFTDWEIKPEISSEAFIFSPPEGVEEILFLAPVHPGTISTTDEGGKS